MLGSPNPLGKVEKTNKHLTKRHLQKLSLEINHNWITLLPITLLCIWNTSAKWDLIPCEMLYVRPFLINDFLVDWEAIELTQHIISLAQFQPAIQQLSESWPRIDQNPLFNPRDEVLVKSLPSLSPNLDRLEGILHCSPLYSHGCKITWIWFLDPPFLDTAVESREPVPPVGTEPMSPSKEPLNYSYEPLKDLKLLLKKSANKSDKLWKIISFISLKF